MIHVNNETGAINDINAIARAVKEKNSQAVFHSDGVQAYGKIPFRLSKDIDLYSVSAHKIGGLKGTGALIKKKPLALRPFIFGGGPGERPQERYGKYFRNKNVRICRLGKVQNAPCRLRTTEALPRTVLGGAR